MKTEKVNLITESIKSFDVTVSIPVKTVYEMNYTVNAENLVEAKKKAIEYARQDDANGRAVWREVDEKRESQGVIKAKRMNPKEYTL